MSTTYSITNTFVAHTTGSASEVNANFTDLLTAINGLDGGNIQTGTIDTTQLASNSVTWAKLDSSMIKNNLDANSTTYLVNQHAIKVYANAAVAAAVPDDDAFGTWASKSNDTSYLAASDGFVLMSSLTDTQICGYTDSNNPPTTLRIRSGGANMGTDAQMMPVKKGNRWKVTGASIVYWLPVGA